MFLRLAASLLLAATSLGAETGADSLTVSATIKVEDLSGNLIKPLAKQNQQATVLIFLTPDCPICNTYAPELGRLVADYQKQGVVIYAVYAGEPAAEIARHLREYKLPLTALRDPTLKLASATGVTVTPEACVVSPEGQVLYRGRIDDRAVKFGTIRAEPGQRNLRLALDAVLCHKPVAEKFTKAIGCYLSIPNKSK
jgi:thiol-disulfide isomerase/thioredoxin